MTNTNTSDTSRQLPNNIRNIIRQLVADALDWLSVPERIIASDLKCHDFNPVMTYDENGWPELNKSRNYRIYYGDTPSQDAFINFGGAASKAIVESPSWITFKEAIYSDKRLQWYYSVEYYADTDSALANVSPSGNLSMVQLQARRTIENIVDQYIHTFNTFALDDDKFSLIYMLWERDVFAKELCIDFIIPLLCISLEEDGIVFDDGMELTRMSNEQQLMRSLHGHHMFNPNIDNPATHAIVSRGWVCTNNIEPVVRNHITFSREYVRSITNKVDLVFAAIRCVTGHITGYSQLLIVADGWGLSRYPTLKASYLTPVREFSDGFDAGIWNKPPQLITKDELTSITEVYNALISSSENKVSLAARRLNAAYLRRSSEDSVVDAIVGLEALLGEGNSEMTHKIATRLALLCRIVPFESYTPVDVFGFTKKLYSYRSAIVHGTHDLGKQKSIKHTNSKEIKSVELAISLLRHAIMVVARHKEYLDPRTIDEALING